MTAPAAELPLAQGMLRAVDLDPADLPATVDFAAVLAMARYAMRRFRRNVVPPATHVTPDPVPPHARKYPLEALKVGQSLDVELPSSAGAAASVRNSIRSRASMTAKTRGWRLRTGQVPGRGVYRVQRLS